MPHGYTKCMPRRHRSAAAKAVACLASPVGRSPDRQLNQAGAAAVSAFSSTASRAELTAAAYTTLVYNGLAYVVLIFDSKVS